MTKFAEQLNKTAQKVRAETNKIRVTLTVQRVVARSTILARSGKMYFMGQAKSPPIVAPKLKAMGYSVYYYDGNYVVSWGPTPTAWGKAAHIVSNGKKL